MGDVAHERIIDLYQRTAHSFDEARSRTLFEAPWLDGFLAELPERPRVLDIGCGSGEPIAQYLIERGASVTGVDAAEPMIELCRKRFPDHEWLVADMRTLDLGRQFDGVIAWHSAFHLRPREQRRMFARYAAHLVPGGALMFTSGPEHGERIGEWQGEPLYSASLAPDEYRALLARNGFTLLDHRLEDETCGGATVWLAQMIPASGLDGSA